MVAGAVAACQVKHGTTGAEQEAERKKWLQTADPKPEERQEEDVLHQEPGTGEAAWRP